MSLKVLELDRFSLACSAEKLKLEVVSAVDFKVPRNLSNLNHDAMLKALTSRQVWVSRGRGCRIDLEVLLDGKRLNQIAYLRLLERLGCQIRDAESWKKLFLSASFEILPGDLDDRQPHISLSLKECTQPLGCEEDFAEWLDGSINGNPPDGVICWEFERLQIKLNFLQIRKHTRIVKQARSSRARLESLNTMLLDIPEDNKTLRGTHLDHLENAAEGLRALPGQISSYFSTAISSDPRLSNPKRPPGRPHTENTEVGMECITPSSTHPYPPNEENSNLMLRPGLKEGQLKFALLCQRQRLDNVASGEDNMLIEDGMLLDDDSENQKTDIQLEIEIEDEDEMLFSQSSGFTSFTSVSTLSLSSLDTTVSSDISLTNQTEISLPIPSACDLIYASISTLLGGHMSRRRTIKPRDFDVSKPPPVVSMSRLVPTMFCPGFKQSMARQSCFLPTISRAMSVSWPRNVQTTSLRRKLIQLSNADPSPFHNHTVSVDELEISERLSSVVRSRLWSMMQRSLYDDAAGKKLWQQVWTKDILDNEDSDFEDLLSIGEEDDVCPVRIDRLEGLSDDEMLFTDNEDDDLLLGEEDDRDNPDWERRTIELETDEMLFGNDWSSVDEDDEEMMLLESSQSNFHEVDDGGDMLLPVEGEGDEMLI